MQRLALAVGHHDMKPSDVLREVCSIPLLPAQWLARRFLSGSDTMYFTGVSMACITPLSFWYWFTGSLVRGTASCRSLPRG